MSVTTPPDRSDSPINQQSVQSSQAEDAWIDQMAGIDQMELLDDMAEYFYRKWLREGGVDNIDDAIIYCKQYIAKLPEGHPDRANMESRLVTCLTEQYRATDAGAEEVLYSAIVLAKKIYDSTSKDDVLLSKRANNYAILLGYRYNSPQRQTDDLNNSIELAEEAVATAPKASAILHQENGAIVEEPGDAVHILNTLAGRLEERSLITGSLADLNRAIGIWTSLVQAVAEQESQEAWPTWLSNLSAGFLRRYEQCEKGDPKDLRRSIDLSREALKCIDDNNPKIVEVLCMLVHAQSQQAEEVDDTNSMDEAIKLLWQAHRILPDGDPRGIEIGFNLAMRLFQCSQMASNSQDERETLNKTAGIIAASSLKFTPENHPLEPHLHNLIGLCNFYAPLPQSPSERDSADKITLEHLKRAFNSPSYVPVYRRVQAGRLILRLCCKRGEWKEAYEASVKAVSLIPKITSRSIRNTDEQRLLSLDDVVGFSADAAAAALNAGVDGYAALDLLEMGRGVLAASVAELRVDLEELRQRHENLADRFGELRDQLQMSSQQYQANLNFDALLNEIRGKLGFENFLGSLRKEDIHDAARDGPVVVLSASEFRGVDAILVESSGVRVLRFAEITMEQLEVRCQNLESLKLLEWLWDVIAEPIMDALGFTGPPPAGDSFSRIWWIPTGVLSRFPLHAAGRHSTSTSTDTVMDRVMSSYSSSIKALLRVRHRPYRPAVPEESRALLVAMTETPNRSKLRHASKETEEVERLLKAKSCTCTPLNDQPWKESVLQHLKTCQIFHFAGHGSEDIFDPSRSALLLQDWETDPMTVDSVLDLNLSKGNCFIAYLSACETGQVTRPMFHDESIHLISAYQLAGFRHVIGTLWSVDDFASVQMATEVYRIILQDKECMTNVSVCRGLHAAAMRLRDESRNKMIERAPQRERMRDRADARKIVADDSSENEDDSVDRVEQFWIPYVHFGV